ncbi:MAG: haloalkane dehalogenase [Gammaproteobacteria bacterium]|nr:haloalkane dehalogenase [Gammaproteobacteria bacterium]MDH3749741.1 haloalkane dehalogenase [Gammaproteobacteria bacterium]MDH3805708.1 haloalkane dehalogenase [Gammaproteobacteria bacterium]
MTSTALPPQQYLDIRGKRMAYFEMGNGDPIVFQHGNPTSSYLWRNIMPALAGHGRCIAVDLIGMGESDKLEPSGPDRYRYAEQRDYLFAAWEALGVRDNVTFVIHDWGSALGFDWARQHADKVSGIAYMEGIVCPVTWETWPDAARDIFQAFRSAAGEQMILEKNLFVERVLPGSVIRELTTEEMDAYRKPFTRPGEDRRPTLTWPRQIPINAEPGAILTGPQREFCRTFPNQSEVTVPGIHFIQEDSATEIAAALADWMDTRKRLLAKPLFNQR